MEGVEFHMGQYVIVGGRAKVAYVDQRELYVGRWWVADPGLSSLITLFTAPLLVIHKL